MIRIGSVELGKIPRIAVPLTEVEVQHDAARIARYADLFELRVDRFQDRDPLAVRAVCDAAAAFGVPSVGTVRAATEGGAPGLDDTGRLQLFELLVPLVDAVDVELFSPIRPEVTALARKHGKPVILSYHNFTDTPGDSDLVDMIDRAKTQGADIVKLALTAHSMAETDRMLGLLRSHRSKHLIMIAMGEHGIVSRVFFPLFGSLVTYGFARTSNAPGQPAVEDVFQELRRYSPEFRQATTHRGA